MQRMDLRGTAALGRLYTVTSIIPTLTDVNYEEKVAQRSIGLSDNCPRPIPRRNKTAKRFYHADRFRHIAALRIAMMLFT